MELIPVFLYGFFLTFILFYSISELFLLVTFLAKNKKAKIRNAKIQAEGIQGDFPMVTVQLPVFNERYVVERLIDSVAALNYPKEKLEIQVLDDSTDDSFAIAERKINELKSSGIDIRHIRRENRTGYKAGALAYGEQLAKGEFIAIFDADFIPEKDFLLKTLPFFRHKNVGVVQSRWGHLNKNYSLITRLQSFGLDAHFSIEQVGRNESGHFINFNGTAGIWRRTCIQDGGGWQADTLTEDLDLSYRAQLKGWKFVYLENLTSPAELPVEMNSLKAQQYRWSKGAAECAKKNLGAVFRSSTVRLSTKLAAFFHLMNSFLFICIFCIGVLSIPVIWIVDQYPQHHNLYSLFIIYYSAILFITVFYFSSEMYHAKNKLTGILYFFLLYPLFLAISMGLSLYNAIGVLEAYTGKKSAFVRTPKFNITGKTGTWYNTAYTIRKIPLIAWVEGLIFLGFICAVCFAVSIGNYLVVPFFSMLSLGFGFVFFSSLLHTGKSA